MQRRVQQRLRFSRRGGFREGAGRPRGDRVSHAERPRFAKPTAVHVTLRARDHVWNLRSRRSYSRIRRAFERARGRFGLRLIHYTVLGNHLHLIVEADDNEALSRGMQGLLIRISKALNAMMGRSGSVFADHYRADLKRTPAELCNAIRYVLENAQRHYGETSTLFSSAELEGALRERTLATPIGWLLRVGWRRSRRAPLVAEWLGS